MVGIPIGVGAMSIFANIATRHLDTLLRVGDYEKPIVGVNDQWKDCAGQVVNKPKVWLAENNAKVQELLK